MLELPLEYSKCPTQVLILRTLLRLSTSHDKERLLLPKPVVFVFNALGLWLFVGTNMTSAGPHFRNRLSHACETPQPVDILGFFWFLGFGFSSTSKRVSAVLYSWNNYNTLPAVWECCPLQMSPHTWVRTKWVSLEDITTGSQVLGSSNQTRQSMSFYSPLTSSNFSCPGSTLLPPNLWAHRSPIKGYVLGQDLPPNKPILKMYISTPRPNLYR